jgi:hypothetical protein
MSKPADPAKWLKSAAHLRGLGHGVAEAEFAPMFERLALRLEQNGIAKAEAEMQAAETAQQAGGEDAAAQDEARGQTGGELNTSTRSQNHDDETLSRPESQGRARA